MPRLKTTIASKKGKKKAVAKKKVPVKAATEKVSTDTNKNEPSCINIVSQTVRWEVVKMAHKFKDDMEVAKLLLNCYDIIISGCLKWKIDTEKTRIPSVASDEGWTLLEEIISVMKWKAKHPMKKRLLTEWSEEDDDDVKLEHIEEDDTDSYEPDEMEVMDDDEAMENDNEAAGGHTLKGKDTEAATGMGLTKLRINLRKVRKPDGKRSGSSESGSRKLKKKYPSYPAKGYKKAGRPRKVLEFLKTPDLPKVFECKRCKDRFPTLEEFKLHFKSHSETVTIGNTIQQLSHISVEAIPEVATVYIHCPDCQELTANYGVHQLKHFRQICDLCGKLFQSFSGWRRHLKYHKALESGEKAHVCDKCGKGFILVSALTEHRRLHSKERPHTCDVCGKGFKQKAHLRRHLYIHSDIKPIICKFCGKGFTNNFNMKSHLRSHTGERPFVCNKCGKAFAHNGSMKTHMKSEHNIDVEYVCQSVQEFEDFQIPKKNRGKCTSVAENGEGLTRITDVKDTSLAARSSEKDVHEALMSIAAGMQSQMRRDAAEPEASQTKVAGTEVQQNPIIKALENANYNKDVREALLSIAAVSSAVDLRMLQTNNAPGTSIEMKNPMPTLESNETARTHPSVLQNPECRMNPLTESPTWHTTTHSTNASMNLSGTLGVRATASAPQCVAETIATRMSPSQRITDQQMSVNVQQGVLTFQESDARASTRDISRMTDIDRAVNNASVHTNLSPHNQGSMNIHNASRVISGNHGNNQEEASKDRHVVTPTPPGQRSVQTQGSLNSRPRVLTINESDIRPPIRGLSRLAETNLRMHGAPTAVNLGGHPQEVMNIHMTMDDASRVSEGNHGNQGEVVRDSAAYETVEIAIPEMHQQQVQENSQLTML